MTKPRSAPARFTLPEIGVPLDVGRVTEFVAGVQGDAAARQQASRNVHVGMVKGAVVGAAAWSAYRKFRGR